MVLAHPRELDKARLRSPLAEAIIGVPRQDLGAGGTKPMQTS